MIWVTQAGVVVVVIDTCLPYHFRASNTRQPPPFLLLLLCSLFLMELLFFMDIVCNPNERARSVHPHLLCFSVFSDVTYSCVLLLQHALRELFTSYFDSNDCFPKRQFLCPKRQRFAKWTVHFAGSCLFNPEPPNLTGGLRT